MQFQKRENVIQDYSQVALLLHSVRLDHSGPFIDALDKKGSPSDDVILIDAFHMFAVPPPIPFHFDQWPDVEAIFRSM